MQSMHSVDITHTLPNKTLHSILGFPLVQHIPRGVWNSIAEHLGHHIFLLTMIDTTTSTNTLLHEVIQNKFKNASLTYFKRFMTCLKKEELAYRILQHNLRLLRLERFNSLPEMRHPMVRRSIREFVRSLYNKHGELTQTFKSNHLIHITQFNLMMIKLFRYTPSQTAIYIQSPMKDRTHQDKHILSVIALLFVEWNMMFDVDESNIRAIIAIVTGHVSYIGKRNQRIYRLLDETCLHNNSIHPLFTEVIQTIQQYNFGKLV